MVTESAVFAKIPKRAARATCWSATPRRGHCPDKSGLARQPTSELELFVEPEARWRLNGECPRWLPIRRLDLAVG
jgi:hypothetical protein